MAATRSLIAIVALALAPACGSDSSTTVVVEGDPVDDTVAEGEARGAALADRTFDELAGNDYLVQVGMTASILASMNDGEIAVADFGAQVVNDSDIFDYANEIIIDHEDANVELDATLRFYGVGYFPSATADAIAGDASATLGELRGVPPSDIDFAFTEKQVIMHAQALVVLDELYGLVGDGEMGEFILDTRDMVDAHLARGEDLLSTYY
jgi:predicted outer membrane protein